MRGGAQGQLMLAEDGNLWVVKFQNNPQHRRVLVNELLATRLAAIVGLSVPETAVIEVSDRLIENTPELYIDVGRSEHVPCAAGLQVGSRFTGGLMPGLVIDFLDDQRLLATRNLEEFWGMLAFDKWTGNVDSRQAVFKRSVRQTNYAAVFIDQGYCFHAGEWRFEDLPLRGSYRRRVVYGGVKGWDSFEPWLSRLETMSEALIRGATRDIPAEWLDGKVDELERLLSALIQRQTKVRELIETFARTDRNAFPQWPLPRRAWEPFPDVRAGICE